MANVNVATINDEVADETHDEVIEVIQEMKDAKSTEEIKEKLAELFTDDSIDVATVIFTIKGENDPQIYRKGHFYDTAALMNHVLSAYRAKAATELGL